MDDTITLTWQAEIEPSRAKQDALEAVASVRGLSVTSVDEQSWFVRRRYLPTTAFIAALLGAPFSAGLSLLLLLWRNEEGFVVSVRPGTDGGTHVRAHGAVHHRAAELMSARFGTQPART